MTRAPSFPRHRLGAPTLLFFLLTLAGCQESGHGVRAPRAGFQATKIDAGRVRPGEQVNVTFPIENLGDLPLRVFKMHGSCGVQATISPNPIPPGTSGLVRVSAPGSDEEGVQLSSVSVYANDPRQPHTDISIRAEVRAAARGADR